MIVYGNNEVDEVESLLAAWILKQRETNPQDSKMKTWNIENTFSKRRLSNNALFNRQHLEINFGKSVFEKKKTRFHDVHANP